MKEASDEGSLAMLQREAIVYANVSGSFLQALVGFADDGDRAVLALEYLSGVRWPPPYPGGVSPLFAALEQASSTTPPPELPAHRRWESRRERIADDPERFLGLGLCSPDWLEHSLDKLVAAETQADFEGDELVHNDVYSGNVCFRGDDAVLIDWGAAVRGSRWIDVAFALLSVRAGATSHPRSTSRASPSSPQLSAGISRQRRRHRHPTGPCRDRRYGRT